VLSLASQPPSMSVRKGLVIRHAAMGTVARQVLSPHRAHRPGGRHPWCSHTVLVGPGGRRPQGQGTGCPLHAPLMGSWAGTGSVWVPSPTATVVPRLFLLRLTAGSTTPRAYSTTHWRSHSTPQPTLGPLEGTRPHGRPLRGSSSRPPTLRVRRTKHQRFAHGPPAGRPQEGPLPAPPTEAGR
jgi:hypothetical protein